MPTGDRQVLVAGTAPAPAQWLVSGNGQIEPKAVFASFNGAAAASAFFPVLKIISDGGEVVGVYPTSSSVAAGGSADVSWFPHVVPPAPAASASGFTKLGDQTVTVPGTNVTFTNLPQTFEHLLCVSYARYSGDNTILNTGYLQFNADNDANKYASQRMRDLVTVLSGQTSRQTIGIIGTLVVSAPGGGAPAGVFGVSFAVVPNYTATQQHFVMGVNSTMPQITATTNWILELVGGTYNAAAPITSVGFWVPALGTQVWVAGSRFSVYGF